MPPFGAISEGIDQPTGAAADRPLRATEIHRIAHTGLVVWVAPNTARPTSMPQISTVLRTRDSFRPLDDQMIDQPAADDQIGDRREQIHGMVEKPADFRMLMCIVCTRYPGSQVRNR